jgi:D-alanyl-D-alanine carboxypeptidase
VSRRSQGWYAEGLARELALEAKQPPTFAGAARALSDFATRACKARPDELQLVDAQGLARGTVGSADALVGILRHAIEGPRGREFVETLNLIPVPPAHPIGGGRARYNMNWLEPTERALAADGTILRAQAGRRHDTVTLAGTLERGGRRLYLAILVSPMEAGTARVQLLVERLSRALAEGY